MLKTEGLNKRNGYPATVGKVNFKMLTCTTGWKILECA